jgi:aryl-alcohol dehydrogenase-like predicted oxidoreductase
MTATVDLTPRTLRGTDLEHHPLVLGTMTFGSQLDTSDAVRVVRRAHELGVTMYDTANSYGDGASEEILGRAIRPFRDEVQLATKVGNRRPSYGPDAPLLDRASVVRECDESLTRLGVDHIDLYYLHMPDRRTPIEETLAACQELVEAGKIRHLGMSNYAAWQLAEAILVGEMHDWPRVSASQPMYSLLSRRIEEEYVACTGHFGVSNLVYNPLAGGLLTGKHRRDRRPAEGTRFALRRNYYQRYWNDAQFDAIERLAVIAHESGTTLIGLSLRWLLTRHAVGGVVLGVSTPEQLEANLAAAAGPAPDAATEQAIDEVWADLRGSAPAYNR